MTPQSIKRVEQRGQWWIATVRFEHEFDDLQPAGLPWDTSPDVLEIAQGASVRRGWVGSENERLVHQVRVPDAPGRDEELVENLAQSVTQVVEETHGRGNDGSSR